MDRTVLEDTARTLREDRERLRARIAHDRESFTRIENARRRIDEGTYGRCLACQEAIEELRLAAAPDAEYCLSCAELRYKNPWVEDGGPYW